jgi:hypothetical protein
MWETTFQRNSQAGLGRPFYEANILLSRSRPKSSFGEHNTTICILPQTSKSTSVSKIHSVITHPTCCFVFPNLRLVDWSMYDICFVTICSPNEECSMFSTDAGRLVDVRDSAWRFWKDEQKIKCGFSKHFSRSWVLHLGYESFKTQSEIRISSFVHLPKSSSGSVKLQDAYRAISTPGSVKGLVPGLVKGRRTRPC